ncbi:2-hydroxy-3-oxopropionate reductase [Yersinia aldovae]|nr:2-hydroxy-3-oxopropionate reductase [Yersinia aldovae]
MVMDRNFNAGFRIDLHIKELANALDTSYGVSAQLPLTAAVMKMIKLMDWKVPITARWPVIMRR